MKYNHDKGWIRKVLKSADIMNTFNGGSTSPQTKVTKDDKQYILKAKFPGVKVEDLEVEIMDGNLLIYHNVNFRQSEDDEFMVPHVLITYPIARNIDYDNIAASYENGILEVTLPFNELESGFYKHIEIEKE